MPPSFAGLVALALVGSPPSDSLPRNAMNDLSGVKLHELQHPSKNVFEIVFSPDSKKLATSSGNGSIHVWDVATGKQLRVLPRFRNLTGASAPANLAFSPNGNILAAYGRFYWTKVRLWDLAKGNLVHEFDQDAIVQVNSDNMGVSVGFSVDGKTYGVASLRSQTIHIRDTVSSRILSTIKVDGWVDGFVLAPDGKTIAVTNSIRAYADTIGVWDIASGKRSTSFANKELNPGSVRALQFLPDGRELAELTEKKLTTWNTVAGTRTQTFECAAPSRLWSMAIMAGTKDLVVLEYRFLKSYTDICVVRVRDNKRLLEIPIKKQVGSVGALSPDGSMLAAATGTKTVTVWRISK